MQDALALSNQELIAAAVEAADEVEDPDASDRLYGLLYELAERFDSEALQRWHLTDLRAHDDPDAPDEAAAFAAGVRDRARLRPLAQQLAES